MLAAALWVSALALIAQALFGVIQRAITPAGLKTESLASTTAAMPAVPRAEPTVAVGAEGARS